MLMIGDGINDAMALAGRVLMCTMAFLFLATLLFISRYCMTDSMCVCCVVAAHVGVAMGVGGTAMAAAAAGMNDMMLDYSR